MARESFWRRVCGILPMFLALARAHAATTPNLNVIVSRETAPPGATVQIKLSLERPAAGAGQAPASAQPGQLRQRPHAGGRARLGDSDIRTAIPVARAVTGSITPAAAPGSTDPVSVGMGGVTASIQIAGPAPGDVAGVIQVNAVVPDNTPTGPAVPIVLSG